MQVYQRQATRRRRWAPAGLLLVACVFSSSPASAQIHPEDDVKRLAELKPRIASLISQLGDDDFAIRNQAQEQLKRLGVVAFDALREAQEHDDVEIARRATYLVRSVQIRWRRKNDPPVIQNVLKEYGDQSPAARSRLLDRLAALNDDLGAAALCRVARFETSNTLARRAALLVAARKMPATAEARNQLSATIAKELGVSDRVATKWLRAYGDALRDPKNSIDAWAAIVARAFDRRDRLPSESNDGQVEQLLRTYVDVLIEVDRKDEAAENARRLLKFVRGRRDTMLNAIDWLLERELYTVVEDLVAMYPQQADRFLSIRYRIAESQRRQGKVEEAEQSAEAALKSRPDAYDIHVRAAVELQERSLLEWSIRELETVIANADQNNLHHIHARLLLAEMHHDYERELKAGEFVAPVGQRIENNDKEMMDRVRQAPISRTANGIVARMHLFFALHYRKQGETGKEIEHLSKGADAEADDADLLIAMYQAKGGDEAFKNRTKDLIDKFLSDATKQLRDLRDYETRSPNESTRSDIRNAIAVVNNQFAWLACNTGRQPQAALRASHRSLELRPSTSAYLDTLAHCYAAIGDYKNAVKYQRQAVALEPHSFQITKKFKLFSEQLAKTTTAP